MKFSSHEKEIIRKIASGEVSDIISYVKAFNLFELEKLDKDVIERNFLERENGKKYKISSNNMSNVNMSMLWNKFGIVSSYPSLKDDVREVSAKISYEESKYTLEISDSTKYTYDYFEGINIVKSFSNIRDFLTIWQYLKSEGLVLEVDKKISKEDYEIFFEYKPTKEILRDKSLNEQSDGLLDISVLGTNYYISDIMDGRVKKNFQHYTDYLFEYNKANEKMCSQFIGKQIYGNSELDLFIKKRFRTKEQINLIITLIPAYLALVITLGIAIWQEVHTDNSDIVQIQNQLVRMQESIESIQQIGKSLSNN